MTQPRAFPKANEQKFHETFDFVDKAIKIHVVFITASKLVFCACDLAEIAAILAQHFPSQLSERVLAFLLPSAGASLRLTPLSALACTLGIAGGAIRIWCHRALGQNFTWTMSIQEKHKLVTTGPYAIVRHPSYAAWMLMLLGNFALLLSQGSYFVEAGWLGRPAGKIVASAVVGYLSCVTMAVPLGRAAREDEMLKEEFGEEWVAWAQRTPYRLAPYIY
ncbi:ICMT-domain-containing protein [Trametes sanguinea]|nr:ICMT-domain-containing protein [Trametes sanguinea]